MKKQFAVVGLGNFGTTIAHQLMELGHEVLGIDTDEAVVNREADRLTQAVIADAGDEDVVRDLGLAQYDAAVVAIGENLEASILAVLALKSAGVKQVWVKALSEAHHRIATRLGADRILHPEHEMGIRVAQSLEYPLMLDYLNLGAKYFIVEVRAGETLEDKMLGELRLDERDDVELLALKHGTEVLRHPDAEHRFSPSDRLVLFGPIDALRKLSEAL